MKNGDTQLYTQTMNDSTYIIGRKYEQELLKKYYNSNKSELVAVYGRRRVGKTHLIKNTFSGNFDFWITGIYMASRNVQLLQFTTELSRLEKREIPAFRDWFAAFDELGKYLKSLKKKKVAVFIDELPWLDTPRGNFIAAFSYFWNMWSSEDTLLKLYVCGSATTWMLDKFIGDKGGLYGRVSCQIYLAPFSLRETELYLKEIKHYTLNRYRIVELYMIMGGIPYYLDMLDSNLSLSENIDNLFFGENAPLKSEFGFLFRSLFKESKSYIRVIEVLSTKLKGMSRNEISEATGIEGGTLSEILTNLCACDFTRKYNSAGKAERDALYQLTDLFSLFHLRFVHQGSGQDESFWSNTSDGEKNAWDGYAFEQVCLHHITQIKTKLGITGVLSNCYSWSCRPFTDKDGTMWNGAQIDLLIDRKDDVINLCEMKFASDEYSITSEYEKKLRNRASLFKAVTKTKKALTHTFITTYGVKKNIHSGIVDSEVLMDDLFV